VAEGAREQQGRGGKVSPDASARLAWSVFVLSLVLCALGLLFLALNRSHPGGPTYELAFQGTVMVVAWSAVGVLIASRNPAHPIGWLFSALGLLSGVQLFCGEYAIYALVVESGSLPGSRVSVWITCWLWVQTNVLVAFMALLFPDGKLPSPRWRAIVWLNGVMAVAGSFTAAFLPGPSPFLEAIDNPFGVEVLKDVKNLVDGVLEALSYGVLGVAGLVALYVRFRRGLGAERQQIKWLAYAGTVLLTGTILSYAGPESLSGSWFRQVGYALQVIGLVGLPVAIGVAIFKYRLYDIDLLINRTLVYGTLTATLIALYFGGIFLLQRIFVLLSGQQSTLAVVASTLLIAAMFNPLRRRIQSFIDRRFYRSKYDARKTLEAFSATLRDETDLDALSGELVGVVRETMQPAHVSLWLRPSSSGVEDTEGRSRGRFPEFP
jgi:hypothetical protein